MSLHNPDWTWLDTRETVTVSELSEVCGLTAAELAELVDYGALSPVVMDQEVHVFSASWVSPLRIYFSAQAVYRSGRFTDRLNTPETMLRADWSGALAAFWETADKKLIIGAGAANLGSKSENERYIFDIRYRF